ncbi:extensin-like [Iris pallida]|uniref:Extensin-like n=1 Tax=Iris pallida TaxID=29817 RepID=A0AAX6GU28_IRIPA|nr:extensin-like [Iris pallida]
MADLTPWVEDGSGDKDARKGATSWRRRDAEDVVVGLGTAGRRAAVTVRFLSFSFNVLC